jgi:hypothetical protein
MTQSALYNIERTFVSSAFFKFTNVICSIVTSRGLGSIGITVPPTALKWQQLQQSLLTIHQGPMVAGGGLRFILDVAAQESIHCSQIR